MSAEAETLDPIEEIIDGAIGSDEQQQQTQEPEQKVTEPTAMEKAVEELARSQKTIVEGLSRRQEPEQKQLTPEQEAEFWAIYNPEASDKEFMRKFFRLNPEATEDEIKQARGLFAEVQKGLVRQSVKGAKNYVDYLVKQIRAEYEPALRYMDDARAKETRDSFFEAYPALKEKKFEKVIAASAQSLANRDFADKNEYFKALADNAAEAIKGLIPEFELSKPQKQPAGQPKLNRTSVGGGGGAGKGRSTVADDSGDASAEIFADDD